MKTTEANINKNEDKFKFQGHSARSQRWFDIDFDWTEDIFSARKPDLYKKIYQKHDKAQDTNTFRIFEVPTGNSKFVEK